jgi:N-acetylmuramoyl-L-alanine amidase
MNKKYSGLNFQVFFMFFYIFTLINYSLAAQKKENEFNLKTVIVDAGHGGKDPGSPGKQTTEKEVALAIALKAGQYIERNFKDVKVVYTRKTDEYVNLLQRAEIANTNKADLFISIHVNGNENDQVTGTESLVLGLHRAGENFEVAKRENSVILLDDDYNEKYEGFDPNNPESYIMFSLMQNLYFDQSISFAALVQEQFRERAQRKDRGVKQQGLLVLAQTAMPGILIETGFITNREEETFLMSEEGQDLIASAIFRAFRDYKNIIESKTSFFVSHAEKRLTDSDTLIEKQQTGDDTLLMVPEENPVARSISPVAFKVQIAASLKPIAPGSHIFKGLSGVTEYRVGNMFKYAVGSSPTFQEIIPFSKQIKERFPDAFVIGVKENKIIPLDQALKESQLSNTNN